MCKTVTIYVTPFEYRPSITEILSEKEYVILPERDKYNDLITHIGFAQAKTVDTRSDAERWQDEYYHSYYPTPSLQAVEVSVSPSVKRIFIPKTVMRISTLAFKSLTDICFEIDEDNGVYKVEDNKIVKKDSGEVIWPYQE